MRKPQGYARWSDPETGVAETDSFTCAHCQKVVFVKPMADPSEMGGHCKNCDKLVCPKCNAKGTCTPWEKTMQLMEARDRFRRSL